MKRFPAWLTGVAIALLAPVAVSAKDAIVSIEIAGATLADPIRITDPAIVDAFSIWIGPGVQVNGQPVHLDPSNTAGMFIDWPRGMAERRPSGLPRFEITFRLESAPAARQMHGWYVVTYELDPAAAGGYIYLPGRGDDGYSRNVSSIVHGVEGSWFHASSAWETLVRPVIETASAGLPAD